MTEHETENENDTPKQTDSSPSSSVPSRGKTSLATLILVGLVVALSAVLLIVILNPPEETVTDTTSDSGTQYLPADDDEPSELEQAASGKATAPSQGAAAALAARVEPTVRLAMVAVPASSQQLQAEAEEVAGLLLQQFPNLPQSLNVAALLKSRTRQSSEAQQLWQKCIELDPKQVAYYVNLAAIAMDRGDSELAVETLEKAVAQGLTTPDVQHHLAVGLTKLGRCEEAEAIIQKALAAHPEASAYWTVLGQAQLKLGKAAQAEVSLKKAIELGSRTSNVYFALGNACGLQQKTEEAAKYRAMFQELKEQTPLDKQSRYDVLSTAEALQTTLTIQCEAAAVCRENGNSMESERLLLRAIALDPTNATPCLMLADLYEEASMLAEARAVRLRLTQLQPLQLLHHMMVAKLSAELHEPEAAEASLKLALAIEPRAIELYAALSQLYLEEGKLGQARWYAQEAVRRQPSPDGYRFLAQTLQAMGLEDQAKEALDLADSLSRTSPKPTKTP